MPLARRPRVSSRAPSSSSAAAAAARGGRGWPSSLRRDPTKRPRRADDDGTPLTDELLLTIFAGVPDIKDLVRCAFTCRRWRRLVSSEAAYICRTPRQPPGRFVGPLALGFFHRQEGAAAARGSQLVYWFAKNVVFVLCLETLGSAVWFCEKSGFVFFSVASGDKDHRSYEMYALSLKTRVVEKMGP
nr:unnamed protein product [Digitaria exilis]